MWEGGGHHERCQDISQELCFQQDLKNNVSHFPIYMDFLFMFSCFTGGIAPACVYAKIPEKGCLKNWA
jgi:hypothetical protein